MPSYAIVFVLFAVVLIAAYFYLMRAKARDAAEGSHEPGRGPTDQGATR